MKAAKRNQGFFFFFEKTGQLVANYNKPTYSLEAGPN